MFKIRIMTIKILFPHFMLIGGGALWLLGFNACSRPGKQTSEPFGIEPLSMFNENIGHEMDGKVYPYRQDYYLVAGYKGSQDHDNAIDSFVCANLPADIENYYTYYISIYQKSEITNVENLQKDPRAFDDYSVSHDGIFHYKWGNGRFLGAKKWRGISVLLEQRNESPCEVSQ